MIMKTINEDKMGPTAQKLSWAFIAIGIIGIVFGIVTKRHVEAPLMGLSDFILLLGLGMSARWDFKCAIGLLVMAITTTVTVFVLAPDHFLPHTVYERYWGAAGLNIGYLTIATGLIFVSIHTAKRLGYDPK